MIDFFLCLYKKMFPDLILELLQEEGDESYLDTSDGAVEENDEVYSETNFPYGFEDEVEIESAEV